MASVCESARRPQKKFRLPPLVRISTTPRDFEAARCRIPSGPSLMLGWSYLELAFVSKTPAISPIPLSIQAGNRWTAQRGGRYPEPRSSMDRKARRPRGWAYQLHDEVGVKTSSMSIGGGSTGSRPYFFKTLGVDLVPHMGRRASATSQDLRQRGRARSGSASICPAISGACNSRAPRAVVGRRTDRRSRSAAWALDRNFRPLRFSGAGDGRARWRREYFFSMETPFAPAPPWTRKPFCRGFSSARASGPHRRGPGKLNLHAGYGATRGVQKRSTANTTIFGSVTLFPRLTSAVFK